MWFLICWSFWSCHGSRCWSELLGVNFFLDWFVLNLFGVAMDPGVDLHFCCEFLDWFVCRYGWVRWWWVTDGCWNRYAGVARCRCHCKPCKWCRPNFHLWIWVPSFRFIRLLSALSFPTCTVFFGGLLFSLLSFACYCLPIFVTLNFSFLPFCNWYPTFSSLPALSQFRVIRIQGPVVSVMCQSSTKQNCAVFSFVEDDGFYKILSERRSHLSLHMFLFLSSHVYFFFFHYSIHLHHHLLFWFISNCLLHVFFCLLTEKSARSTFPNLQNFRVGVLRDLRRVFIHATPVFFDRGIANLDTKVREYTNSFWTLNSLFIIWGRGLWIIPLYELKLDVVKRILLGKKCVCDIIDRGGKYENILYFDSCNRKWLKVHHIIFILFYLEGC